MSGNKYLAEKDLNGLSRPFTKPIKYVLAVLGMSATVSLILFIRIPFLGVFSAAFFAMGISFLTGDIKELGFRSPISDLSRTALITVVVAVLMVLVSNLVLAPVIESITETELQIGPFSSIQGNKSAYLLSLGIGWVCGALAEEILFRGYLMSRIQILIGGRIGVVVSVVVTSVFFGFLHDYQGITGQILIALFGIVLGTFYMLNNRNIWFNILLHGLINTISLSAIYFGWVEV